VRFLKQNNVSDKHQNIAFGLQWMLPEEISVL